MIKLCPLKIEAKPPQLNQVQSTTFEKSFYYDHQRTIYERHIKMISLPAIQSTSLDLGATPNRGPDSRVGDHCHKDSIVPI